MRSIVVGLLCVALTACSEDAPAPEASASPLPTTQPDGSPLTAEFCAREGDSTYSPFGNAKACYLQACQAGDDASCEALKDFNGNSAQQTEAVKEAEVPSVSASIWTNDQSSSGTCFAQAGGITYMDGPCSGTGHGDSIVIGNDSGGEEFSGCHLFINKNGNSPSGDLGSYRNQCGELSPGEVPVGPFKQEGACWVAANVRFCLKAN